MSLGFSPDGSVLVGGADAGTVMVWTAEGRVRDELTGPSRPVVGLGFSPDGSALYTLTADGRLSAWDLRGDRRSVQLLRPPAADSTDLLASPSPDGAAVAVTQPDVDDRSAPLTVVDVGAGTTIRGPEASPHDGIVAWQPGGTGRFATHSADVVRVWDWRRGRQVVERRLGVEITTVAYTPDGRQIIVGDGDGSVYRIDAETLLPVGARARVDDDVDDVEWVGEDRVLAMVQVDPQYHYRVVDLANGATGAAPARRDGGHQRRRLAGWARSSPWGASTESSASRPSTRVSGCSNPGTSTPGRSPASSSLPTARCWSAARTTAGSGCGTVAPVCLAGR